MTLTPPIVLDAAVRFLVRAFGTEQETLAVYSALKLKAPDQLAPTVEGRAGQLLRALHPPPADPSQRPS
jgi:hypothetical protein